MRKFGVFILFILLSSFSQANNLKTIKGQVVEPVKLANSTATFRLKGEVEINGCDSQLITINGIGFDNSAIRLVQVAFDLKKAVTVEYEVKKFKIRGSVCEIKGNDFGYVKDRGIFSLH